jgi:hypothetical protein
MHTHAYIQYTHSKILTQRAYTTDPEHLKHNNAATNMASHISWIQPRAIEQPKAVEPRIRSIIMTIPRTSLLSSLRVKPSVNTIYEISTISRLSKTEFNERRAPHKRAEHATYLSKTECNGKQQMALRWVSWWSHFELVEGAQPQARPQPQPQRCNTARRPAMRTP